MSKLLVFMVMGKYCTVELYPDSWSYCIQYSAPTSFHLNEPSPLYSYDIEPSAEHLTAWSASTIKVLPYNFYPITGRTDDIVNGKTRFNDSVIGTALDIDFSAKKYWRYEAISQIRGEIISPLYGENIMPTGAHFAAWARSTIVGDENK